MDDDKEASLIFVNSGRGQEMLEKIKGKTTYEEMDINQAVNYNSPVIKSVECNPKREDFFRELDSLEFDELVKKYCTDGVLVRGKRKARAIGKVILKKTGIFELMKRMIERN